MDRYLSASRVKEKFDISRQTLFNWEKKGLLTPGKTPGNQRRYSEAQIKEILGIESRPTKESVRLRRVARAAAEELAGEYGRQIREIILYGSVARGEADRESDIDLAVLIEDQERPASYWRRDLHRTLSGLKVKHGVSISIQVFTVEEWQNMEGSSYYREVTGEHGVKLHKQAA